MTTATRDRLLTKGQVAAWLGVSIRNLERYVKRGLIPQPLRVSKRECVRWRESTLLEWLAVQEEIAQRRTTS